MEDYTFFYGPDLKTVHIAFFQILLARKLSQVDTRNYKGSEEV